MNSNACSKCKDYKSLEDRFKALTENYERLTVINKMLQEQNKDKELAFEVQIAELKSGFEKAISENI